jgi:hypothetical protein
MPNFLTEFVRMRPGCDELHCSACGGLTHFRVKLESFVRERSDLNLAFLLAGITEEDVRSLNRHVDDLAGLFRKISQDSKRSRVIRAWTDGPIRVPLFAYHAARQLQDVLAEYPHFRAPVLETLLSTAVGGDDHDGLARRTRDLLARVFSDDVREHTHFQRLREVDAVGDAYRADLSAREANRLRKDHERQAAFKRDRDTEIAAIADLPSIDRIRVIVSRGCACQ